MQMNADEQCVCAMNADECSVCDECSNTPNDGKSTIRSNLVVGNTPPSLRGVSVLNLTHIQYLAFRGVLFLCRVFSFKSSNDVGSLYSFGALLQKISICAGLFCERALFWHKSSTWRFVRSCSSFGCFHTRALMM